MTPFELPEDEAICDINLTPLVDVSLVLVIIFMVMAPFCAQILKPLRLPQSAKATLNEDNSIRVSIFEDGTMAMDSGLIVESQLEDLLRKEFASGRPAWAVLRAPDAVPHGRVMDVLKRIKQAGAERVAFAAQPKLAAGGAP